MIAKLQAFKQEIAWVVVGQALALMGSLAGIKLLTNIMSQAAYGELALGLSIAGLMNMFLFGPLGQVILRYYSVSRERGNQAAYIVVLKQIHARVLLAVAGLGVGAATVSWFVLGEHWTWLIVASVAFGVVSGLQGSFQSYLNAARERKLVATFQSAEVWMRYLMAFALVVWCGHTGYWAMAGYVLGSVLVLVVQGRAAKYRIGRLNGAGAVSPSDLEGYGREFRNFGMPFVAFAALVGISQFSDRWLLQGLWGAEEVGIFAALFQVASAPVVLLSSVFMQFVVPIVFARAGALGEVGQAHASKRILFTAHNLLAGVLLLTTLSIFVWGEDLVGLVTNEEYAAYGHLVWILVLGQALFYLAQLLGLEGLSQNQSIIYTTPKAIQAGCVLVFGYLLAANFALYGMAIAICISSVAYYVAVVLTNKKMWRKLNL